MTPSFRKFIRKNPAVEAEHLKLQINLMSPFPVSDTAKQKITEMKERLFELEKQFNTMKVFDISHYGERSTVQAHTQIEALIVLMETMDFEFSEFDKIDTIVEVPESDYKERMIQYHDEPDIPDESFPDWMEDNPAPAVIVSTEWK